MPATQNSIVIAPKYLHYDLRLQWMKERNVSSFSNTMFLTMDRFLEQYATSPAINELRQIIDLYHIFSDFNASVFQSVLLSPSFLKELQRVMNLLIANDVDINDFPEDTPSRKELKMILLRMRSEQRFDADYRKECMTAVLKESDLSHIEIHNFIPGNPNEESFFEEIIKRGAMIRQHHQSDIQTKYHYALNIRQEVEAVAQHICELLHDQAAVSDIAIMVSDLHKYTPFIEQVFPRYQLPFTLLDQSQKTQMKRFFNDLFSYYEKPTTPSLLDLIAHPILFIPYVKELKQYVIHLQIPLDVMFESFSSAEYLNHHINSYTKKAIEELEFYASQAQQQYLELFEKINETSFSEILLSFYQHLVNNQDSLLSSDIEYVQSVRYSFQQIMPELDTLPLTLAFTMAKEVLQSIRIEKPRMTSSILISDIERPFLPAEYGFALGFHQPSYPNFKPLNGIFDESIASLLPGYELLAKRYHRHLQTYENNLHFAKCVTFSYPQGNFEGKVYESSLDLEIQFQLGKAVAWPIKENDYQLRITHELDEDTAKQLFIKDKQLIGSISRFESYFRCPYSYFLKYGLQLQEPLRFSLMEAEIGQVYHGFFDEAVTRSKKQYVEATDEEINNYLSDVLAPYKIIFKDEVKLLELVEDQLRYQIKFHLTKLKTMEQHTSFEPTMTEKQFDTVITNYEDIAVRLTGIIDRIDEITQGFRILDYKSSARSLRLSDFYAGLALQLITYTYIAQQMLNKKAFGCYYVNLSQPTFTHVPFVIDRRKKTAEYVDEETFVDENDAPNKLKGLTFIENADDINLLDDSQSMITGLSYRKTGTDPGPTVKSPVDFNALSQDLLALYQELAHRITNGRIELEPVEGACTYCKFKVICHFKGKERKPRPVIYSNQKVGDEE